ELGDAGFLDPAAAVRAAAVGAGVFGAALADLTMAVDGDLPGAGGNGGDGGALAFPQFPANGVDQLVPRPGCELIQALDQAVAGPGAVAGDHQPPPEGRRQRGDRRAQDLQVIGGGVGPGAAFAQLGGQRLRGVVTPTAPRGQAFSLLTLFPLFVPVLVCVFRPAGDGPSPVSCLPMPTVPASTA